MLTNLSTWLLEAAPAAAPAADAAQQAGETGGFLGMIPQLAMMVVMVGVFYFLLIRPQRKKDKAVKDMLAAIKTGDRICTIGGIYGTVTQLKDDTVTITVGAPKTPIVLARWAVRSVENAPLENDAEPQV